jgi:hypothetical protein
MILAWRSTQRRSSSDRIQRYLRLRFPDAAALGTAAWIHRNPQGLVVGSLVSFAVGGPHYRGPVSGVGDRDGQKVTYKLLALLLEWIREARTGSIGDEDLLTRLYLLRDLAQASAQLLVLDGVAVAGSINRSAAILRDEADRDHAVRLLRLAADQLCGGSTHPPGPMSVNRPGRRGRGFEHRLSLVEPTQPSPT